jgi:hypothetical protein
MNMMSADVRDILRLQRNLKEYARVRAKVSKDEILNKKGNDLRIRLFRGFWSHRWKKREAKNLLKNLLGSGKGIHVRLMQLVAPWAGRIPATDKKGRPLNDYQKLVAQEVLRRASGIGILGVSFLRKRWRYRKEGRYLTENRTRGFGRAVSFQKTDDEFIITGWTPGLARVAAKFGILGKAIREVSADLETYLSRKLGPEFVAAMHAP